MVTPVTSDGSRSGVNWMRCQVPAMEAAKARASEVLPTPGTSSTRMCPSASRQVRASATTSGLPRITCSMLACSRASRLVRSSGAERYEGIESVVTRVLPSALRDAGAESVAVRAWGMDVEVVHVADDAVVVDAVPDVAAHWRHRVAEVPAFGLAVHRHQLPVAAGRHGRRGSKRSRTLVRGRADGCPVLVVIPVGVGREARRCLR